MDTVKYRTEAGGDVTVANKYGITRVCNASEKVSMDKDVYIRSSTVYYT